MTKETLVVQLEAAKSLSSQVDIDKVIELIKQIETPTRFTQELADEIASKIERCLDNNSDDLVNKEDATFDIGYGNVIEIDDIQIDVYEVMRHIIEVIDDFVSDEYSGDEDENETGHTLPGFENGSGIDQVTIY
jgi:hypothetical protein